MFQPKDRQTVLIVDDIPANLEVLNGILQTDYTVKVANSGEKALQIARRVHPDIILLDIMMPEMDGLEVCRRLKADAVTSTIPVIFVTALEDIDDESQGFDVGGVDYIRKPVSAPIVRRRVATHLSLVRAEQLESLAHASIRMLGEAGHYNDTDTGQHIWRMAAYSQAIAEELGWSPVQVNKLGFAAPMHDTGKIGTPDSILKAPRPLTPEEWEIMQQHTRIGCDILSHSSHPVFALAAEIALNHHEQWDGSGYPRGIAGEEIPESARIVAVADVYDALTSKRPYKKAWTVDEAMAEIQAQAGKQFDPRVVECLFRIRERIVEIGRVWEERSDDASASRQMTSSASA